MLKTCLLVLTENLGTLEVLENVKFFFCKTRKFKVRCMYSLLRSNGIFAHRFLYIMKIPIDQVSVVNAEK
jgi:hypothetical protein